MRPFLALLALLSLAACAGPPREWAKPDADREAARQDLTLCRRAAAAEALRLQVDYSLPRFGFYYRPRFDNDRAYNEQRLTSFCMRNKGYELAPEATNNIFEMTPEERTAEGIASLPQSLGDAIDAMESSELVAEALGEHVFDYFIRNKRAEWEDYRAEVTPFELDRYLGAL